MSLPIPNHILPIPDEQNDEIVRVLEGYRIEAEQNRKSGLNPRDDQWRKNVNLYWNRYDFSQKLDWQAKETMPEVPSFVDRFAASLKEALLATPEGFYTVTDPYDKEGDMAQSIKRMMDASLTTVGRNQLGTPLAFPAVFEEQMKLGAIMACSGVVLWKNDVPGGRVAIETVDPRSVWLDHTYRDLYRVRRVEMDQHELKGLIRMKTSKGNPLFNLNEVDRMVSAIETEAIREREEISGGGAELTSGRKIITMDEYRATVVRPNGEVLKDQLFVVGNNRFLLRGPEANPFWHNVDWLFFAPLITAPLSVYGRSYMEDFGSVAETFTELTNLILDAVRATALKAYAVVPAMLTNPKQAIEGISPGKTFFLEEGFRADEFARELDLGTLDAGAVQVWQNMKSELSEAAGINEIGLGQFAPKGRTSATEVSMTQTSSSAIIRSVAQTIETRVLDIMLDLAWKTLVQHVRTDDRRMASAAGEELFMALMARRKELIKHPITFQARGISVLIQRGQMLQKLLMLLQVVSQNENLMAAFMQAVDINKLLALLFQLSNVDLTKLQASRREQMIQGLVAPMQERATQGTPSQTGQREMSGIAQSLGIAPGG